MDRFSKESIMEEIDNVSMDTMIDDMAHFVSMFIDDLIDATKGMSYSQSYEKVFSLMHSAKKIETKLFLKEKSCPNCNTIMLSGDNVFTQMFSMAVVYIIKAAGKKSALPNKKQIENKLRKDGVLLVESTVCHSCGYGCCDFRKVDKEIFNR